MGQVIAFVSGKGGTGKTSLVAGVGSALALRGRTVLCVDCDIGLRNLDIALGMTDRALMDFSDVLAGRSSFANAAVRHTDMETLYLLTAPLRTDLDPGSARRMSHFLTAAKQVFDYVLTDAPAGLGDGFSLALSAADRAILVTQSDPSSLRDAQHTVSLLSRFPREALHLIVNRVDPDLLRSLHATIDDAMDSAGLPLLGVVPEDSSVTVSLARGTPLLQMEGRRPAGQACRNIAARIEGERIPLLKL